MADQTIPKEGRLSRWSRLKRGGEEKVSEAGPQSVTEVSRDGPDYAAPDPHAMPGGAAIRRGSTVPAMASLVRDDDKDEGEGISSAGAAAPSVASQVDTETYTEGDDPPLTPEQEAIVGELPAIETLDKNSDFTPFLADKVPEFIRRKALSVLWRSDPVLANLDGLNDYDENYRVIDTLISAAKDTIYRVGKGHKTDEELAEEAAAEAAAEEAQSEQVENADGSDERSDDELVVDTPEPGIEPESGLESGLESGPQEEPEVSAHEGSGSVRKPEEPV